MKPHTLQTQSAPCELATLGCSQDDLGKGTTVMCQRRHGARISRVTGRGVRQVTEGQRWGPACHCPHSGRASVRKFSFCCLFLQTFPHMEIQ